MDSGDKNWASKYLLDPLTAPQPSQETGPGTSFRPDTANKTASSTAQQAPLSPSSLGRLSKKNPFNKSSGSTPTVTEVTRSSSVRSTGSYPSPQPSASPTARHSPSHRQEAFAGNGNTRPRRSSSLTAKFPGDMSHRPLDQLKKEKAVADRSRHATKKHHIRPDTIDNLDDAAGGAYHHGGPYDATLFARNNSSNSPLQALAGSNAEALKATPHEKIVDSVQGHRPLDGVAAFAPGERDRNGHVYNYEQGENMMIDNAPEGGAYKRWPGLQYHPDDIKGKGEPSYSIEKALKEHKLDEKDPRKSTDSEGIEMKSRSRPTSGHVGAAGWDDGEEKMRRSGSLNKRLSGGGLKKRIGSIKKHLQNDN